ncbi:MAG: hypothetical protein LC100_14915 [Chitinophagales bacterium]|nr:hypothetical protein [Chitinophagales bacterium]
MQEKNKENRYYVYLHRDLQGQIFYVGKGTGARNYTANWTESGILKSKTFAVNKYGEEEAYRLACEARLAAIERLKLLGFVYTDRHVLAQ